MQINFSAQPSDYDSPLKQPTEEKENLPPKAKIAFSDSESEAVKSDKLQNLQDALAENDITLKFRQDEKTKQLVVELVNSKTGDSIRQIPTEVSLRLSAMYSKIQGQFVDKTF